MKYIRNIAILAIAIVLAGCSSLPKQMDAYGTRYEPAAGYEANTIVVDTTTNELIYYAEGSTFSYPVATAKPGKEWSGITRVGLKREYPSWKPTETMVASSEFARNYPDGLEGGDPENPLGSRALYLYGAAGDTLYRIHGTSDALRPSIGSAASLGCIRMLNEDIEELYDMVDTSTTVVVWDGVQRPKPYTSSVKVGTNEY